LEFDREPGAPGWHGNPTQDAKKSASLVIVLHHSVSFLSVMLPAPQKQETRTGRVHATVRVRF